VTDATPELFVTTITFEPQRIVIKEFWPDIH
jgi:hypothetical protein